MPNSKRVAMKRKHTAAINSLIKAQGYLVELYDTFVDVHPKYAEGYGNIVVLIQHNVDLVKKMKGFI